MDNWRVVILGDGDVGTRKTALAVQVCFHSGSPRVLVIADLNVSSLRLIATLVSFHLFQ